MGVRGRWIRTYVKRANREMDRVANEISAITVETPGVPAFTFSINYTIKIHQPDLYDEARTKWQREFSPEAIRLRKASPLK